MVVRGKGGVEEEGVNLGGEIESRGCEGGEGGDVTDRGLLFLGSLAVEEGEDDDVDVGGGVEDCGVVEGGEVGVEEGGLEGTGVEVVGGTL